MDFWGTYFPVLAALISWSVVMEILQIVIQMIYARRQSAKIKEIQEKLAAMESGQVPMDMDFLNQFLGGGQGMPSFGNAHTPVTVSGSGIPSHGQYL